MDEEHTLGRTRQRDFAGPAMLRRLNRTEYATTIRDLLGIHIDAAEALPSDGAGGEGFDNAADTLFISPIHAEKYLDAARTALRHAFADTRAKRRILIAQPSSEISPEDAAAPGARQILTAGISPTNQRC